MIGYAFRSSEDPRTRINHTKESYNNRKSVFSRECNHQKYIPEHIFEENFTRNIYTRILHPENIPQNIPFYCIIYRNICFIG